MLRESTAPGAEPAPPPSKAGRTAKRGRARAVLDRTPPGPQGWRTTDDDEIALRRWRGSTEIVAIEALEAEHPILGTFRARSETGGSYEVEVRGLDLFTNSCGCIDHRVNGLGTCKHVEGVLAALRRRGQTSPSSVKPQKSRCRPIRLRIRLYCNCFARHICAS